MNGFKILDFADIQPQLEHLHEHGWDAGLYVGFPNFKPHYNMTVDGCTDWTGYPSSGKTELLLELLFSMSTFYGWKYLLYVPDIGKSVEVMAKLIHKYTGKTFIKRYNNYIDIATAFNSCGWLLEHFKILHKVDVKAKITPLQLWDYAIKVKEEQGLNSVVIDSWKDLFHDYSANGGGYATYLSHVLPIRNAIAEKHKLHMHTVIHPKNPLPSAKTPAPMSTDMEGGAQWSNSGKCIIAVHREDFDNNIADIYFRKIKPESVGRNTSTPVTLTYDIQRSRFYYGDKLYAAKERVEIEPNPIAYEF